MTDWNQMEVLCRGAPEFVDAWVKIVRQGRDDERAWVRELIRQGYKAAHPNDGWVNRKDNILTFCYPQFDHGAGVGDRVMLGWASGIQYLRPIVLTEDVSRSVFGYDKRFRFVDAPSTT